MGKKVNNNIEIFQVVNLLKVKKTIFEHLGSLEDILPESLGARVLIKPNLNSNMNALTGNTTDLRVLAAIIEFLKGKYRNR